VKTEAIGTKEREEHTIKQSSAMKEWQREAKDSLEFFLQLVHRRPALVGHLLVNLHQN
jgi:hypothetical protein